MEYGKKSLGYDKSHIYELADAGEIGLQVGFSTIAENQPKESQLRPLKAVPEEERKAIWEEATRKAEEEHAKLTAQRVESAVKEWKQRSQDWHSQFISERDKLRQSELERVTAQKHPAVVVEKIPADCEALKAKAAQLATELATKKAEQNRIIQSAIKAKLSGYQGEMDALEARKRNLEQQAKDYQNYLASLTGTAKQMEAQTRAFEKTRQALVDLASELSDFTPVDPDLTRRALALAEMHGAAAHSLRLVFEPARPTTLTVIQGHAA